MKSLRMSMSKTLCEQCCVFLQQHKKKKKKKKVVELVGELSAFDRRTHTLTRITYIISMPIAAATAH